MIDRVGQLWEHYDVMYLVLQRVPSDFNEYAWLALCVSDCVESKVGSTVRLSIDFFDQEWWHRVA